jgi:hypothetical protein
MTEHQAERFVNAFEKIAAIAEAWYKAEHPEPKEPREAVRTYAKSPTSDLEKELGNTGEATIEEWTNLDGNIGLNYATDGSDAIGEREREFLAAKKE